MSRRTKAAIFSIWGGAQDIRKLLAKCMLSLGKRQQRRLWTLGNYSGTRGGSRNSGKGVHMYKGVGVSVADFISFF